ncbi:pyridoxal phosphate-dependent decarboxylase family protein [Actinophytocola xanthii]|uniref:Amino acid decarboxylase n=1 Tax=Actinophytocola xanthii TaxID=1912961 RepID=A0A1Q8CPM5_9PSEU|nr:aminotransferase class V-fold PLP-dependent enzyme [Actinophytocola xanthii]OLF16312.1 amino acid decarboxylase [Actinophytocola xanthii]
MHYPLEPTPGQVGSMMAAAEEFVADFLAGEQAGGRAWMHAGMPRPTGLADPPAETPGELDHLLGVVRSAVARADDTTSPRCFAYFPGGGLVSAAVAELLARVTNRYTGSGAMAEDLVAMEHGVIRWLAAEFGLPTEATGLTTTGSSTGTLSAVVAARHRVLGGPGRLGTLYVTEHTHHSVAKAARLAGFPTELVRTVPVDRQLRMDARAVAELVAADHAAGRRPFLLVGTAGTTNTGTVDPLAELAATARRWGLWFHVDAAYGGGFQLTERGRRRLTGIEAADSIVLDLHKSLFLPYTTGVLLVRDPLALRDSHAADAEYLQDLELDESLPNYADLGVELSREYRGLRVWLPLHLHGVAAFRAALDEKLDLSEALHEGLSAIPGVETTRPDLTVHTFRVAGGEDANRRLLAAVNGSGRARITSTRIGGRTTLRMCVLNHRTREQHVAEAVAAVRDAVPDALRAATRAAA